jgi:phytoene/squalene synthetase
MNNFKTLAIKLLDDDEGITDDAFQALRDLGKELQLKNWLVQLGEQVKATNGRFYLPEGHTMTDE